MSNFSRFDDIDPTETSEWLESIDSVLAQHGPERAHFLLNQMIDYARRSGAYLPYSATTAYLNTISLRDASRSTRATARSSGASRLIFAGMPWPWWCRPTASAPNTVATSPVMRRPPPCTKWASTISGAHRMRSTAATWYSCRDTRHPGIYARAYLEGRLDEAQLNRFRKEVGGGGLSSYPHPWLMPDFWQFPTVSMGLGPMMAIYQARLHALPGKSRHDPRTVRPQGLVFPGRRRNGRARVDGRHHDAGPGRPRQPDICGQL